MVRNIILHMGMYHTGTTSLQEVLSQNPPELQSNGMYFFTAVPLTYALHRECNPKAGLYGNSRAEDILSDQLRAAEAQGAHTLVLSHEGISYNSYYRNMTHNFGNTEEECAAIAAHIRHRLRELLCGFNVNVVFYPRRQDHWIVANYCNAIDKNGIYTVSFDDILRLALECLNYASLMDQWAGLFGKQSITIRPYEKIQQTNGTLADFCEHVLHCPVPAGEALRRSNQTPGGLHIRLMQALNRLVYDEKINEELRALGREQPAHDSRLLLGHEKRLEILHRFEEENTRLAREYMGRADGRLFYEAEPDAHTFPAPEQTFTQERLAGLAGTLQGRLDEKKIFIDPALLPFVIKRAASPTVARQRPAEIFSVREVGESASGPDLVVRIPTGFLPERKYAVRILFTEIMGFSVFVQTHDKPDYAVHLPDGRLLLTLADEFFRLGDESCWPTSMPQPAEAVFFRELVTGLDLVTFYGQPACSQRNDVLHCAFDILGMTFFLLSRIGELFAPRDNLGRALPGMEAPFLRRPVINEWAAFLRRILAEHGLQGAPSSRFAIHMTHDIDHMGKETQALLWLAETDKNYGLRSTFNFMGPPSSPRYDDAYMVERPGLTKGMMQRVRDNFGHVLGFHPGFDTCVNRGLWMAQKTMLEELSGIELTEGRQHYLKYFYPFTWRIFEESGMRVDTGLCYPREMGFKSGTACAFTAFDFVARRPLALTALPLLFMDASYTFSNLKIEDYFERFYEIADRCVAENMPCCLLFHNTFFTQGDIALKKHCYEQILKKYA